jgi:threonine dehydrogenase-like Zn-dependent dehydrogenase
MRALQFKRNLPRYGAAMVAGGLVPGLGARVGPLKLGDIDEPDLPGPEWRRIRPRLAGICGSDLSTIDGKSSRYFEPIVSFPFVPGHEVVGELDDGTRVVIEPVLGCEARGVEPACPACARGHLGNCERIAFGHLAPGLQTGFCADTGGGWSLALVAHESQLHVVPDGMSDDAAVMIEPTACAIHAVEQVRDRAGVTVVIGAGTLGLLTVAALARPPAAYDELVVVAKYPAQAAWARALGATIVVEPDALARAVRRTTGSFALDGGMLTGGADTVFDCVGSAASLSHALSVTKPRGHISVVGMPGTVTLDLTPLWHKEITLGGAYAYGTEGATHGNGDAPPRRTFDLAFELVQARDLGRLVSAHYSLDHYRDAIEHAADAGRRGATKIAFDMRAERRPR